MKLFKKLGLVIALGSSLVLASCGGDNPNETTSASDNPTCKSTANWAKISKGLTESKVLSILGNPKQISSNGSSKTYTYEKCRGFYVYKEKDDPATLQNERDLSAELLFLGGVVVFNLANNGYVASFTSPGFPTELHDELTPDQIPEF